MKNGKSVFEMIVIAILGIFLLAIILYPILTYTEIKEGTLDELHVSAIESVLGYDDGYNELHRIYLDSSKGMKKLLTREKLNLPEDLLSESNFQPFGLRIYDGSKYVPIDTPDIFDENKKTLMFAHGMGGNAAWENADTYFNSGYNVLTFFWGSFAREDNLHMPAVCDKVWFYDGNLRYVTEPNGEWNNGENINYSVAEIYAAYYTDLLLSHPDYDSREIIIAGHSYGGMLTTGLLSYLTTAFRSGILPARLLPDRVVLCDPYFMQGITSRHIRWLNNLKNPDYGGIAYLAYETVQTANKLGISVSLIRTNYVVEYPITLAYPNTTVGSEMTKKFNSSVLYVDGPATGMLGVSESHVYGLVWPALNTCELYDSLNPDEYAYGIFNPYHADYARVGETYSLDYNNTPDNLKDDIITLLNPADTKIYGFVYNDVNGNGIMDERITKHISGAQVVIKNSDNEIVYDEPTSLNGYFSYRAKPGEYTVTVTVPENYSLKQNTYKITVNPGDYFKYSPIAAEVSI